jgi:sterol desaturase/sphingolipid hydroxylase (fatty acid hydroxylase superfamily)
MPVFLLLCAGEAVVLRRQANKSAYRLADFLSGLGCGIFDQVISLGAVVLFVVGYDVLEREHGWLSLSPSSVWAWVTAVFAHDLAYYWFHRLSHRINLLWASHVVHHQSESYNFTVSLRQGAVATWVTLLFYVPLAWIGIPAEMFVVVHGAYQIYQFLVHTELCPRLGPLEWVLASPRNHRVHHGRNGPYLDRNYGGFFIIWDRLFQTYVDESVEPEIGTRDGMRSWSPLWANFGHFAKLAREAQAAPDLSTKLLVWLGPPEGRMSRVELVNAPMPEVPRYDVAPSPSVSAYVAVQLLVLGAATLYLLVARATLSTMWIAVGSGAILAGLITLGALLDTRSWAWRAELARLVATAVGLLALLR